MQEEEMKVEDPPAEVPKADKKKKSKSIKKKSRPSKKKKNQQERRENQGKTKEPKTEGNEKMREKILSKKKKALRLDNPQAEPQLDPAQREMEKVYTVRDDEGVLVVEIEYNPINQISAPPKEEVNTTPPIESKKPKDSKKKRPRPEEKPNSTTLLSAPNLPEKPPRQISELETRQAVLVQLKRTRQEYLDDLAKLRDQIGKKLPSSCQENTKTHWDYLLKEMEWMAKDFERERRVKSNNAKKLVRANTKFLGERIVVAERCEKHKRLETRKNASFVSKMVQQYWKSIEKIVKHNYSVIYESKKQTAREKRLKTFVNKHLKLSEKVAEELKSKTGVYSIHPLIQENNGIAMNDIEPKPVQGEEMKDEEEKYNIREIAERAAEIAKMAQPTGFTLSTSKVTIQVPYLIKHTLREYQIIGLDWLMTLHDKKLNGILADEMGLGKTIQTIALLAGLAVEKGIWGPHLIVVPTTIIINWEMEFKRWCPGFKILTYFGSQRERKLKRSGWSKSNAFHVCITSYKLVIQDHFAFRRKKWYYMVLDEAQNIKNFRSQRWQLLLKFNTRRRLLLTGTPLQNDVMELWSLMHFLMPQIFSSHDDFKEWFYNPFAQSINSNASLNIAVVQNLQSILRPFLLRRLKKDVEKQLPEKMEHIIYCNLSRRQRFLYDEYINCERTQKTLISSDFFSIMNILMQLRKVCNHPDLFESRHINSPFSMKTQINYCLPAMVLKALQYRPMEKVNLSSLHLLLNQRNHSIMESKLLEELMPERFFTEAMQNIYQYPHWAYSYYPTKEGFATAEKYPTGNILLKKSNISGKEILNHPLIGNCSALPHHLSLTNVPYLSSQFALKSAHELFCNTFRQSSQANRRDHQDQNLIFHYGSTLPYNYFSYKNCFSEFEQLLEAKEQFDHLVHMRDLDFRNRLGILNSTPIYCNDLKKAVKVPLLCYNIYQKNVKYGTGEVCQSVLNKLASQIEENPGCSCEDLDTNDIPSDCTLVFECINKKTSERRRIKKPPSYKFDPFSFNGYLYYREDQEEDRRLVINIDKSYLKELEPQQEVNQPEPMQELEKYEENKHEENMHDENMHAENKGEEDKHEENMHDENMHAENKGEEYQREEYKREEPQEEEKKIEYEMQNFSEDDSKMSEFEGYLTRSKVKNMELKSGQAQPPEIPYNGATIELIPGKILESMLHPAPLPPEPEPEENIPMKEPEEDPADSNKFFAYRNTDALREMIKQPNQRQRAMNLILRQFKVIQPPVLSEGVRLWPSTYSTFYKNEESFFTVAYRRLTAAHFVQRALRIANFLTFPDRKLIQYDSGKLQKMSILLKKLRAQNSKVLIFTQMSKMLDIIEAFLNLDGHTYVRLDGSIKVEVRQNIIDRFNNDPRIFCFISSTRCGGIGINLTAADAVIFYDSDWNPAMDKQAQDRCHRIGQTKTVHIYRLITLNTIEENIFKKSLQKREIGGLIMEDGQFDTDFFQKINFKQVVEEEKLLKKHTNILQQEHIMIDSLKDEPEQEQNTEFMKKLEAALFTIEDKEDVEACEKAKKEIVDEFEFSEHEDGNNVPENTQPMPPIIPKRREETEFKRNEVIDWENDDSLLKITKKSLEFYRSHHTFDEYFQTRSLNDKRFIPDVPDEEEAQNEEEEAGASSDSASADSEIECDGLPDSVKLEAFRAYEEALKNLYTDSLT